MYAHSYLIISTINTTENTFPHVLIITAGLNQTGGVGFSMPIRNK